MYMTPHLYYFEASTAHLLATQTLNQFSCRVKSPFATVQTQTHAIHGFKTPLLCLYMSPSKSPGWSTTELVYSWIYSEHICKPLLLLYYFSTSLTEEKRHCEELSSELGRRVKEGEEEGRRVILERKQFAEQLQEMRKQLREEIQAREAAERRAKQEVRERGGGRERRKEGGIEQRKEGGQKKLSECMYTVLN